MPPVREASTKPIAATVLPAPVACSNQKRLWALGSSAAPSATSSSTSVGPLVELLEGRRLGDVLLLRLAVLLHVEVDDQSGSSSSFAVGLRRRASRLVLVPPPGPARTPALVGVARARAVPGPPPSSAVQRAGGGASTWWGLSVPSPSVELGFRHR
jgi:hypothetical protein